MDVWHIIHIILAVLLLVNSLWSYADSIYGVSGYFISTFFAFYEILIIIFPFVYALAPYFGFLSNPVGPAISLIVISVFYFPSLLYFCYGNGYFCLGQVTGCIVLIVCVIELFMKKDAFLQVGHAAVSGAKQLGGEAMSNAYNMGGNGRGQEQEAPTVEVV